MAIVELTKGQVAIVDDTDLYLLKGRKWQASPRRDGRGFYVTARGGVRLHRLLMGAPKGLIVDHIDGNGLNNRRANLRVGTQSQNCVNRKTTPGPHLRGVTVKKGRFRATIKYKGEVRHLGCFDSEVEAHEAYRVEALRIHGEWLPYESPPLPLPPA